MAMVLLVYIKKSEVCGLCIPRVILLPYDSYGGSCPDFFSFM